MIVLPKELVLDNNGRPCIILPRYYYFNGEKVIYSKIDDETMCEVSLPIRTSFVKLQSTDDYILKFNNIDDCQSKKRYIEFVERLRMMQSILPKIDFPIGYIVNDNCVSGQVIRYYKDGMGLANILLTHNIEELLKYYDGDDNARRNLLLLCRELILESKHWFEEGFYYKDIKPSNFVLNDGKLMLIDFDYNYIEFKKEKGILSKGTDLGKCEFIMASHVARSINIILSTLGFEKCFDESKNAGFDSNDKGYKKLEKLLK